MDAEFAVTSPSKKRLQLYLTTGNVLNRALRFAGLMPSARELRLLRERRRRERAAKRQAKKPPKKRQRGNPWNRKFREAGVAGARGSGWHLEPGSGRHLVEWRTLRFAAGNARRTLQRRRRLLRAV